MKIITWNVNGFRACLTKGFAEFFAAQDAVCKALKLPTCSRKFPAEIGKGRPCVYRQIGRCCGLCAGDVSRDEYGELIKCAIQLLRGNTEEVEASLIKRMMEAAEDERFEEAARCRDSIQALKKLGERQKTQLSPDT